MGQYRMLVVSVPHPLHQHKKQHSLQQLNNLALMSQHQMLPVAAHPLVLLPLLRLQLHQRIQILQEELEEQQHHLLVIPLIVDTTLIIHCVKMAAAVEEQLLAHEYMLKTDAVVNMGTGPCGIEILQNRKNRSIRFNIITYYNDFMQGVMKYRQAVRTDNNLQHAFDSRMKGKQRLKEPNKLVLKHTLQIMQFIILVLQNGEI
jgi:hypothetical protein